MEFLCYQIPSNDFRQAGAASRAIKERLKRVGADSEAVRRAVIAAYEAEMNVVIHSVGGRLEAALSDSRLDVTVSDDGPGIADLELAMTEGYSTASAEARALGFGAGMGLPNIKKNADRLRISSKLGEGTRVSFTVFLRPQSASDSRTLSLRAFPDRCRDCRACLRACPTQAMRVRSGQPSILEHLCIDCAQCIGACSAQALAVQYDVPSLDHLEGKEQMVLVVPSALLASCGPDHSPQQVLAALQKLGFADVLVSALFEEALREEGVSKTAQQTPSRQRSPVILPTCPAVINLVELRFPALLGQILPYDSPWEAAQSACQETAVAYVVSCPSQRSAILAHEQKRGRDKSGDVVFLLPEVIHQAVMRELTGAQRQDTSETPGEDRELDFESPPPADGETFGSPVASHPGDQRRTLRVTGVDHVIAVLEKAEDSLLEDVEVIEPYACEGGCFGSPLLPEEYHLASYRWIGVAPSIRTAAAKTSAPQSATGAVASGKTRPIVISTKPIRRRGTLAPRPGIRLDPDMGQAIRKLGELQAIIRALPGRDCGSCGAPTCAALAEDVVMGRASLDLCPYKDPAQEEHQQ